MRPQQLDGMPELKIQKNPILHSIETPIYIQKMEQKGNKINCKRKENKVHKR